MTWDAAMRWALVRAKDTGARYRVYGYRMGSWSPRWAYAVGKA